MKLYEFLQDLDRKGTLSVLVRHGLMPARAYIIIQVCTIPHKNRRKFQREQKINVRTYYEARTQGMTEVGLEFAKLFRS